MQPGWKALLEESVTSNTEGPVGRRCQRRAMVLCLTLRKDTLDGESSFSVIYCLGNKSFFLRFPCKRKI